MKKNLGKVAKFVAAFAFSLFVMQFANASDLLHQFAAEYKTSRTEQDKLDLCIRAVNAGLIARGAPVKNLDIIFGTNFSKNIPGEGVTGHAVYFKHHSPPINDAYQADTSGWFLSFQFDHTGKLLRYYISNVEK